MRYFAKALDISPAVKIPPTMATKAVKAAFAKAEDVDPATIGDLSEADAPTSPKKPSKKEEWPRPRPSRRSRERQEKAAAAASSASEKKQAELDRRAAEAERKRTDADRKKSDAESKALVDDLAQTKVSEAQLKSDRDKLEDPARRGQGLSAAAREGKGGEGKADRRPNTKVQQLEKEKADRDAKLGPAGAKIPVGKG